MKEFSFIQFFYNTVFPFIALFLFLLIFNRFRPNRFLSTLFSSFDKIGFSFLIFDFNRYVAGLIYIVFVSFYIFSSPVLFFYLYRNISSSATFTEKKFIRFILFNIVIVHSIAYSVWYYDIRRTFGSFFDSFYSTQTNPMLDFTMQDASQRIFAILGDLVDTIFVCFFFSFFRAFFIYGTTAIKPFFRWVWRLAVRLTSLYFFGGDNARIQVRLSSAFIIELIICFRNYFCFLSRHLSL